MKALKIVFILIAIVFVGVFGYYQIKYNSDDISFKNPFSSTEKKKDNVVFRLSNIEMTLNRDWNNPSKNAGELKVDFVIENISIQPQKLYLQDIGVFDSKELFFAPSLDKYSKLNPLLGYAEINPNMKRKFTIVIDVTIDDIYAIAYSDHIQRNGKQRFIDNVRMRRYEYETFKNMIDVKSNSKYTKISDSQFKEITVPPSPIPNKANAEEIIVDLNDYLGSPIDDTDWNYTEIDKEIELHLKEKGVYFSNKKKAWVRIEK